MSTKRAAAWPICNGSANRAWRNWGFRPLSQLPRARSSNESECGSSRPGTRLPDQHPGGAEESDRAAFRKPPQALAGPPHGAVTHPAVDRRSPEIGRHQQQRGADGEIRRGGGAHQAPDRARADDVTGREFVGAGEEPSTVCAAGVREPRMEGNRTFP